MSAHRQSKAHIDALVTAAITMKIDGIHQTREDTKNLVFAHNGTLHRAVANGNAEDQYWCSDITADDIGKMLWDENTKSLTHRYDAEYADDGEYGTYQPTRPLNAAELSMAIDGYMYQSCEHPEWLASMAYAFCIELKAKVLSIVTRSQSDNVKTWSITEETVRRTKDFDDASAHRDFLGDDGIHIRAHSGPVALIDWMLAGGTNSEQ